MPRESMQYDVIIVGAGPAGLCSAIRLAQLAKVSNKTLHIAVVEKGAEVGAHILSGAVLEPRALNELLPDWQQLDAPITTPVTSDTFYYLTEKKAFKLPTPPQMKNAGNFIISLGLLCRWLATQAESLGIEIYPGFAATEVLFNEHGDVMGIATGDMGLDKQGNKTARYQEGMELHAKQTLFAEGAHGSLTKYIVNHFQLRSDSDPQTYGLGLKELWQVSPEQHKPGKVIHTVGWPLDTKTYGGSFIYHLKDDHQVAVGLVVGLDYQNPYLSPFQEFQRFKTHPALRQVFENGKRIAYGARVINEGGFQSLPKLSFPGGLLIGCAAGFLNVPKIKGTHLAMKSGMLAAETVFKHLEDSQTELLDYTNAIKASWVYSELKKVRNIRPSFRWGFWAGMIYSAVDTYILRGHAPWTLHNHADYQQTQPAKNFKAMDYPKPDGKISFDRLSSVFLSGTMHEENQPCHLQLKNLAIAIDVNYNIYQSPEQHYCPAGVYEIIEQNDKPQLQINAQNCIHCKTCDIKDPKQNIHWVPPEGGGGPNYPNM